MKDKHVGKQKLAIKALEVEAHLNLIENQNIVRYHDLLKNLKHFSNKSFKVNNKIVCSKIFSKIRVCNLL